MGQEEHQREEQQGTVSDQMEGRTVSETLPMEGEGSKQKKEQGDKIIVISILLST